MPPPPGLFCIPISENHIKHQYLTYREALVICACSIRDWSVREERERVLGFSSLLPTDRHRPGIKSRSSSTTQRSGPVQVSYCLLLVQRAQSGTPSPANMWEHRGPRTAHPPPSYQARRWTFNVSDLRPALFPGTAGVRRIQPGGSRPTAAGLKSFRHALSEGDLAAAVRRTGFPASPTGQPDAPWGTRPRDISVLLLRRPARARLGRALPKHAQG